MVVLMRRLCCFAIASEQAATNDRMGMGQTDGGRTAICEKIGAVMLLIVAAAETKEPTPEMASWNITLAVLPSLWRYHNPTSLDFTRHGINCSPAFFPHQLLRVSMSLTLLSLARGLAH